ncbi:hypothetical protein DPMN_193170 [Dreissena polymorpha]|uniref:G-protein coupled receptors family 1 profile domain-containing protein n=1 Tax=Dreissena polymorpha TaxID=45954 RepID=A0A9D3Y1A6_DREPO|nr:hypothetical protein DPMN_193170 [Dreissena polymorpha]
MALDFNISLENSSMVPYEYHKDQLDIDADVCIFQNDYHRDLTQNSLVVILMIVLYMLITVLALLGNLLVIWTVWINSHMHTVTNYYIVNLAVSDLLVAALVIPLKLLEYTAPAGGTYSAVTDSAPSSTICFRCSCLPASLHSPPSP